MSHGELIPEQNGQVDYKALELKYITHVLAPILLDRAHPLHREAWIEFIDYTLSADLVEPLQTNWNIVPSPDRKNGTPRADWWNK